MAATGSAAGKPEEGLVNPHIPEFMAKAPWYLQQGTDKGLAHQRRGEVEDQSIGSLERFYSNRGQKVAASSTFRKGACKNCGSATHTEKQCTDRPRKVGAWKTGVAIASDEALPAHLQLGWDAKRDRYAGYDIGEHEKIVARYQAIENERVQLREEERRKAGEDAARTEQEKVARRALRAARRGAREARRAARASGTAGVDEDAATDSDVSASSDGTDSDFSSSGDERARARGGGQHGEGAPPSRSASVDSRGSGASAGEGGAAKMVSWNVRTREDTAKYLLNLDTESAFYDPKTRSMRENPYAPGDPRAAMYGYTGDNAMKSSGQVGDLASDQLFAWEAYNRGTDVHLQGNPTQVAMLKQQFAMRKEAVKALMAKKLADRYGGSAAGTDADVEHADALRLSGVAESVAYTEYVPAIAPDGRIVPVAVDPTADRVGGGGGGGGGAVGGPPRSSSSSSAGGGPIRSRYVEDVCPGSHTAVYGSWFDVEGKVWGFACCHQTLHGSYCTGQVGKAARAEAADFQAKAAASHAAATEERMVVAAKRKAEADEETRSNAVGEEERSRKRARAGDPVTGDGGGDLSHT